MQGHTVTKRDIAREAYDHIGLHKADLILSARDEGPDDIRVAAAIGNMPKALTVANLYTGSRPIFERETGVAFRRYATQSGLTNPGHVFYDIVGFENSKPYAERPFYAQAFHSEEVRDKLVQDTEDNRGSQRDEAYRKKACSKVVQLWENAENPHLRADAPLSILNGIDEATLRRLSRKTVYHDSNNSTNSRIKPIGKNDPLQSRADVKAILYDQALAVHVANYKKCIVGLLNNDQEGRLSFDNTPDQFSFIRTSRLSFHMELSKYILCWNDPKNEDPNVDASTIDMKSLEWHNLHDEGSLDSAINTPGYEWKRGDGISVGFKGEKNPKGPFTDMIPAVEGDGKYFFATGILPAGSNAPVYGRKATSELADRMQERLAPRWPTD